MEALFISSLNTQKQGVVGAGAQEKADFSAQQEERADIFFETGRRGALGSFHAFVKVIVA
ncbi:MAG: hypothetical protein K9N47_23015 [Prosthecobacter sp.]|uniref:hypothetical protein n=1 Tax=Prosthecobacter sp. TaxID=1965333 RepID=UPI00262ACCDE|nr:hypothetical protein [Prosthecobacter sp.]MCF7789015.1 hypothetical protein [Prosthecobacter sp.]